MNGCSQDPTRTCRPSAAWVELLRLPIFLTVFADLAAGVALGGNSIPCLLPLAFLISACLYTAGMILNDLVDLGEDRRVRPDRPLPSRRITRGKACMVMLFLFGLGLGGAWMLPFPHPAGLAWTGLAIAIVLYNLGPRRLCWWGPLFLALCRGLDVVAGALLPGVSPIPWGEVLPGIILFATYAAAITFQAAGEDENGLDSRRPLLPLLLLPLTFLAVGDVQWTVVIPLLILALCALRAYFGNQGKAGARQLTGVWIKGFFLLAAAICLGRGCLSLALICAGLWLFSSLRTPKANLS